jgi:hypothetical protein
VKVLGEPPWLFDGAYVDVVDTYTGPALGPASSGPIEDEGNEAKDDVDEDEAAAGGGPEPGFGPEPLGKLLKSLVCRRTGIKYLLCCWYCRWGVGAASPSIKSGALSSARDAAHNVVGLRILYN